MFDDYSSEEVVHLLIDVAGVPLDSQDIRVIPNGHQHNTFWFTIVDTLKLGEMFTNAKCTDS